MWRPKADDFLYKPSQIRTEVASRAPANGIGFPPIRVLINAFFREIRREKVRHVAAGVKTERITKTGRGGMG